MRIRIVFVVALGCSLVGMSMAYAQAPVAKEVSGKFRFAPSDVAGEYRFDTGVLRGTVRRDGASTGLLPVEHVGTGTKLSGEPGLLTYYRIFTTNRRYGESARARPSDARLLPDGALQVTWSASEEHPYTLTGIYRWRDEGTLDLETVVEAKAELPDFEVFLSSYLGERFHVTSVCVKRSEGSGELTFMDAESAYGIWQVYPRDAEARSLVEDGRWTIPPNPVDWAVMPDFAVPLAYRRDPETGLIVALMAPVEDCFAVFTPERDEPHRSMYLSFFGRTLQAGETARAHARMVVAEQLDAAGIATRYDAYVKEIEQSGQE